MKKTKAEKREEKNKETMKVSGRSVFSVKKLIVKKSLKQKMKNQKKKKSIDRK